VAKIVVWPRHVLLPCLSSSAVLGSQSSSRDRVTSSTQHRRMTKTKKQRSSKARQPTISAGTVLYSDRRYSDTGQSTIRAFRSKRLIGWSPKSIAQMPVSQDSSPTTAFEFLGLRYVRPYLAFYFPYGQSDQRGLSCEPAISIVHSATCSVS